MGLRYRKSLNIGKGIRINISTSGVGYSFGVPGARVTKTASGSVRQTYSIPGSGISYVTESSSNTGAQNQSHKEDKFANAVDNLNFNNLDSGIYNKEIRKVILWRKISKILLIFTCGFGVSSIANHSVFPIAVLLFLAWLFIKKSVGKMKVDYELDDVVQTQYYKLCNAWLTAFGSMGVWQISQTCITNNKKDNCGAKIALNPVPITEKIRKKISPDIRTNIEPVCVPIVNDKGKCKGQVLILPDRVLISKGSTLAAIELRDIKTTVSVQPMAIPSSSLYQRDAKIVGYKYMHENSDGSADKRFKDNPKLPIINYGRIDVVANGSAIISLLFSNITSIESIEKDLSAENLMNIYN